MTMTKPKRTEMKALRHQLSTHMQDRALEWFSALVMLSWGMVLAMPGDTMAGPAYAAFHRFGTTEDFWAWAFGMMGGIRLVALYINGRWPRTPVIRMVCATFGAMSWAQVSWMLTEGTYLKSGIATTGTAVYGILALADLFSIFRAAFDARYHRS